VTHQELLGFIETQDDREFFFNLSDGPEWTWEM